MQTEIRKIQKKDSAQLLSYFKELVSLDPERVERIEDVNLITLEQEESWADKLIEKENMGEQWTRIGIEDDIIVVEAEIERRPRWIERHVAEIRFGVIPGKQELAKAVLENTIEEAKKGGIEVLYYFHLESQKAGIELIRSLDFQEAGKIPHYYKRGNEYKDRIYFSKVL